MENKSQILIWSIRTVLAVALLYITVNLIQTEAQLKETMVHKAKLNDASADLFDTEVWKYKMFMLLDKRIDSIDVHEIADQLSVLIEEYYADATDDIRDKGLFSDDGNLWDKIAGAFGNAKEKVFVAVIDGAFPELKNKLITAIKENDENLKRIIKEEIYKYMEINAQDIRDYKARNHDELAAKLEKKEHFLQSELNTQILYFIIVGAFYFFFLMALGYYFKVNLSKQVLIDTLIIALFALAVGVTVTILEIRAEIVDIRFELMGEEIAFTDQILYYQRKSIVDVATALFPHNPFVAIMIVSFSILFPIVKNSMSFLVLFNNKLMENKYIAWIIKNIGKWSMADVFVVALFLAYLGYDSLITNQMESMYNIRDIDLLIDASPSTLQYGFWFFLFYVIASIASGYLFNGALAHEKKKS